MTPQELRESRLRLGLNIKQMAHTLECPYRTYQNWELGLARVPGIVSAAIKLLEGREQNG